MARKGRASRPARRGAEDRGSPLAGTARLLLLNLFKAEQAPTRKELVRGLHTQGYGNDEITRELGRLIERRLVVEDGRSRLSLNRGAPFYTATLEMKPAGFGFATDILPIGGKATGRDDLFIGKTALFTARHGDRILILVTREGRRNKEEAEVLGVVEQARRTLAGFFTSDRGRALVYPEDPRFPFLIEIADFAEAAGRPKNGEAVIVRLDPDHHSSHGAAGTVIEILGNPARPEVQLRLVAEKFQMPVAFSAEALLEAQRCQPSPGIEGREDLRKLPHFTIDGAEAKDFDDAVTVARLRDGYRLHVSIADVSAYVHPGSRLDLEAYRRGTSAYFPGQVLPMLPERLSNDLCSLMPDQDRLTMTAVLDFDRRGALRNKRFVRSVIRSRMRFTYDTVKQIVIDREAGVRECYQAFLKPLQWAAELAEALQRRRGDRGSVVFAGAEPEIRIDADGAVLSITERRRSFADQIIEEFMLAANEAVAVTFAERGEALLYRIHERPDPEKIEEFSRLAVIFGLQPGRGEPTPHWYNDLVGQVQGTPRESIVNSLLLRTLQQARYSPDNCGHFGLGAPFYTHFTSPIRRYPDLIVHRLLGRLIDSSTAAPDPDHCSPAPSLDQAGQDLSDRERNAMAAERDLAERYKCRYMQQRIGERFTAIISAIAESLFFVELPGLFVSGAVLLSSLKDDYYLQDWKHHRLIGDVTGRILQVGDIIEVQLAEVDTSARKITFTLV